MARFSETLNERDAQLRNLLANANKATGVLAERSDQVVSLVARHQRAAGAAADAKRRAGPDLGQHLRGQRSSSRDSSPRTATRCKPALDKLNGVLTIVDNRKERVQQAVKGLNTYAMSLGESVSSGPFFKAYVVNLLPGSVRPAVHRRRVLRPRPGPATSAAVAADRPADRPAGHPGAAGAVPAHRPGRRAASDPARRDHRQPRRSGVRSARPAVARPYRRYPYREPLPAPPPGGPPPGPPAAVAARAAVHTGADARAGRTCPHRVRRRPLTSREANR